MLYIVPTPIGNLEDMTFRAVRILKEVDLILAEDTRTSGRVMKHYEVETPLRSLHAHNEHRAVPAIIEQLKSGQTYALVSDAGTPGISDPGSILVQKAVAENIRVEPIPGPSSESRTSS